MLRKEKTLKALFILFIFSSLFASGSFAASDVKTIDTGQLHSMIVDNAYELEGGRNKQFIVVDARTKKEYDEVHIFSSISIPEDEFEKSMNLLPQNKEVLLIVYCNDTNSDLSQKWAGKATAAGYLNIVIYKEG